MQALAAVPAGISADRHRRDMVLIFAAFLGAVAFGAMILSLLFGQQLGSEYGFVCASLGLVSSIHQGSQLPTFYD